MTDRRTTAAYRALRRLAEAHPDEYAVLHDEERDKLGYEPVQPARVNRFSDADLDHIRTLYVDKRWSCKMIGQRYGLGPEAIRVRLDRAGIPRRTRHNAQPGSSDGTEGTAA